MSPGPQSGYLSPGPQSGYLSPGPRESTTSNFLQNLKSDLVNMILRRIQDFDENAGERQRCGGRVIDQQETEARQLHPDLKTLSASRFEDVATSRFEDVSYI